MKAARLAWFDAQPDLDPERLVFIDETAAATNMVRRYARAPRGQRCRIAVPQGHYKTTTVTAALRASGPLAIDLKDGATTGAHFRSYVADTLAPALRPGEQLFAKLKALLRTAAARTIPALLQTIREAFTRFRPDECRNYIAASGQDACDPNMIGWLLDV